MKRAPRLSTAELVQRSLARFRAGDLLTAARLAESVLAGEPRNLGALTLLSSIAMQERRYELAASLLERATQQAPHLGMLHSNHGEALRRLGRKAQALECFQRAVRHNPELSETHYNLGLAFDQLGRVDEAVSAYEAALTLRPTFVAAAVGFLGALRATGQYARAIDWYQAKDPSVDDTAELRCAVAGSLLDVFRIDEAVAHLERAIQLAPNLARAHSDLAAALAERAEIDAALVSMRRAVELEPENAVYHGNLVYLTPFSPRASATDLFETARAFGVRHAPASLQRRDHQNSADAERRLRVGYVSADFRDHPVARFVRPLFREHDRSCVEVVAYSNVRQADAVTLELRGLVDEWRDISSLDDDAAAELIRNDAIDILVDLSQHSAGNRLLLFARKPAPVQLSWLGYPGPTGVEAIDCRLTDAGLDSPAATHAHERLLWLVGPYWCYAPPPEAGQVSDLPALKNGRITFGCLNSFKKAGDQALELWASVLAAVADSRLLLVAPEGAARARLLQTFAKLGVGAERLELLSPMSRQDYFATYERIDIALDPAPYCGGTTTLDALWMGLPVVTLSGTSAVTRSGAALARWLDWGCAPSATSDDYVRQATLLAEDRATLATARGTLRGRMSAGPLMNVPEFVRSMEQAFRQAWLDWCRLP